MKGSLESEGSTSLTDTDVELHCGSRITAGGLSGSESRFVIETQLSSGGSGEVWLAYDEMLGVRVALKIIHSWVCDQPSLMESLRAEVIAGRLIHSKHVLKVHDLTHFGRKTCLVMNYVEGKTLSEFCRNKCGTRAETYSLARQLCQGVEEIHRSGFAHRDLTPSNIIVNQHGFLTIVDLGLVSVLGKAGVAFPYQAPELHRPCYVLSDIYALGKLIQLIAEREQQTSSSENSWLQPIFARCLCEDPKLRFTTVSELISALDIRWFCNAKPRSQRHATHAKLILAAIVVAGCAAIGFVWHNNKQHDGVTQLIVMTTSDDSRVRFLADVVTVYLETKHLAVASLPVWLDESKLTRASTSLKPIRIKLSIKDARDHAGVLVEIAGTGHNQRFALPFSKQAATELVERVAKELKLGTNIGHFGLEGVGRNLQEVAQSWQTSEAHSELYSDLKASNTASVPLLLLRTKLDLHRYASTKNQDAYSSVKLRLAELRAAGVVTSQTVLWHASLLRLANNSVDSVQVLQQGLRYLATTAPIYRALSDIELRAGFGLQALELSSQGIARDPFSAGQFSTAARAHIALGEDRNAIRCLLAALELNERDSGAHTALGNLYILLEQFHEGAHQLELALDIKPSADGYVYFGLAQILSGRVEQGLLILRGTAAKDPTLNSLGTLGAALRWQGDKSSGVILRRALQVGNEKSTDATELGRLAVVHAQLLETGQADALLERAGKYGSLTSTELIYDALIVDAFAHRRDHCKEKLEILKGRRFPIAFVVRDPQVSAELGL